MKKLTAALFTALAAAAVAPVLECTGRERGHLRRRARTPFRGGRLHERRR